MCSAIDPHVTCDYEADHQDPEDCCYSVGFHKLRVTQLKSYYMLKQAAIKTTPMITQGKKAMIPIQVAKTISPKLFLIFILYTVTLSDASVIQKVAIWYKFGLVGNYRKAARWGHRLLPRNKP